jgi:hypothetical protein
MHTHPRPRSRGRLVNVDQLDVGDGLQGRRVRCTGTNSATGLPVTVIVTRSPASTRRSTPAVSFRSSREGTLDIRDRSSS